MIVLRLGNDSNEIVEKIKFCLEIANENVSKNMHLYFFDNRFLLENLIAATLFGDLVSLYSALLQNLDPSRIRLITEMKNEFEPRLNKKINIRKELLNN